MAEIYWIQRLGDINMIAWVVFGVSLFVVMIFCIIAYVEYDFIDTLSDCEAKYKASIKVLKKMPWIIGISAFIGVFVPSEKQCYAIFGIGGAIDYIKSNETAKQLPDKVVKALDAWVDKQINDNEKEK